MVLQGEERGRRNGARFCFPLLSREPESAPGLFSVAAARRAESEAEGLKVSSHPFQAAEGTQVVGSISDPLLLLTCSRRCWGGRTGKTGARRSHLQPFS